MSTFVLVHGAGDVGWYWHLVAQRRRGRGHDVVAPDLPCDDDSAGLAEYADTVVDATSCWSRSRSPASPCQAERAGGLSGNDDPYVCLCTEDRFFTAEFMRRVVAQRLGIVPDELASGHCPALSRPDELADMLHGYVA